MMLGVEDDLEGGEDNKSEGSLKPRKEEKSRKGDSDGVWSLPNIVITTELQWYITAVVEHVKVGHPKRVCYGGASLPSIYTYLYPKIVIS